ncbi:MAG: RHS repeat-associated core domain-containing protein, partial [Akkermansia sp.]|nr:RHS repeat-associated core domain-containing protein [Akkermansia sp.]
ETDSLVAGEKTHLITELRDSIGRSVGYTYAKDGAVQQTVGTSYGTDGRIIGAGFLHGGELKEFTYTYVTGSHLLQGLAMPNNMALSLSYETQRDLMTGMVYTRGTTTVVQRGYSYDALGRPLMRTQSRQGGTRNDSFVHNDRSELTAATLGTDAYAYAYDNIGNRLTAQEAEEQTAYTANNLNQYTAIQEGEAEAFAPTYDADGNQTLVKTSTGIWTVTYNAANRPVVFANEATGTVVECSYDSSGRRATKKVTVNGTVTLHQRYIYRGYLQIACCDLTRTAHPCLWLITWDPTHPIATRPLAIQKDGTWYTYGWDLTKNVTEVFTTTGYIGTAYTYTPYGEVSASGNVTQPIQWSSEYHDVELGLVYYNYRHYNPVVGRWTGRDGAAEFADRNLYNFLKSNSLIYIEYLGYVPYLNIPLERIKDFILKQNESKSIANDIDLSKCIYFVFYDREDKKSCFDHRWHRFMDNNYISHVAVYTSQLDYPLGFNPSTEVPLKSGKKSHRRIISETRTDIALIIRLCAKNNRAKDVQAYLDRCTTEYYSRYYFPIDSEGHLGVGRRWYVNGPNCATFAANVLALYLINDKPVAWDRSGWFLWLTTAHRPEEVRQHLQALKNEGNRQRGVYVDTIYNRNSSIHPTPSGQSTPPLWQGDENNTQ